MHIGIFTYYYHPVVNGVVFTIQDWLHAAREKGIDMTIVTPKLAGQKEDVSLYTYPAFTLNKRLGVTISFFSQSPVIEQMKKIKVDVLHAHHPFFVGSLALSVKRALHLPLVFTYHTRYSDYFETYFPFASAHVWERIIYWHIVRFMNACDAITVATSSLKHELLAKGVRAPIFIVPPGIDTKRFQKGNKNFLRNQLSLAGNQKILLYVGRIAKEKNIYFLLKSFMHIHAKSPKATLVLVGKGMEEGGVQRFIQKAGLARSVFLLTDVSPKDMHHVYRSADMFVYASTTETFGRVLVEAMSSGLPVVALAAQAITDLFTDGVTGKIVFKKAPTVFAKEVLTLLKHPQIGEGMGKQAQDEAQKMYDNTISFQKLSEVYDIVSRS